MSPRQRRGAPFATGTLLLAATVAAEHRYVDLSAAGSGDGSSWLNAFTELQTALAAADSGDVIWVASGIHRPSSSGERDASFQLPNGVELYGGFAGDESLLSQRDPLGNPTELSGDIGVLGNDFDNSYHVLTTSACDSTCLVDGFTITKGLADGPLDRGGGILNIAGSPRIANVILIQNQAASQGGAVYNVGGSPRFSQVDFIDNWSTTGAGCYNDSGQPSFSQVSFQQNSSSVRGGGLYDKSGASRVEQAIFTLNGAFDGGAVYCDSSATMFEDVEFVLNGADCFGGAIFTRKLDPQLRNVRFERNIATFSGGAMYVQGGAPRLIDVVFQENSCAGQTEDGGGGMFNSGANPQLVNVVFDRNSHFYYGGGMANVGSSPQLINVSFAGNVASGGRGGAISNRSGSHPQLSNVICWGDSATVAGDEIYNFASTPILDHCIVAASGGSGPNWDPTLGVDAGGNGELDPLFVHAASGNLRLSVGSAAMNRGSDGSLPFDILTDLDGNARQVGQSVDIGAYELIDVLAISGVSDIANDQGRFVRLSFVASSLDVLGSSNPILQYESYRRIDDASKSTMSLDRRVDAARARGMISSSKILAYGWDYLGAVPAHASGSYNVVLPTLADSTAAGIVWSAFFVRAATAQPTVFYDSPVDSGYSVDNLAPAAPFSFGIDYVWQLPGTSLQWSALLEPDLSHFRIYRGDAPDFQPAAGNHVANTAATNWSDPLAHTELVYYKVSAVDFAGNESPAATPSQATAVAETVHLPTLLANQPNPAAYRTALRFALPAKADFRLVVYDSAGRRVWMREGRGQVGENSLMWDGRDSAGHTVASGSYYVHLQVGEFSTTRKLLFLR